MRSYLNRFLIFAIITAGATKYIPMFSSINEIPHPNIFSSVSTSTMFSNVNDVSIGVSASLTVYLNTGLSLSKSATAGENE